MKIRWKKYGKVVELPGMPQGGVPAMRLVVFHAPQSRIEVVDGKRHTLAALVDLDWSHESLAALNAPPRPMENSDRAQLAALGASNHQHASAAAR